MPKCESCGNEHSGWGKYCPVCKAKIEAAETERKYWEHRKSEEDKKREEQELEIVKERLRKENRAIVEALEKQLKGEPINVTARICRICGHTNGAHESRCEKCGSDAFFDVEL